MQFKQTLVLVFAQAFLVAITGSVFAENSIRVPDSSLFSTFENSSSGDADESVGEDANAPEETVLPGIEDTAPSASESLRAVHPRQQASKRPSRFRAAQPLSHFKTRILVDRPAATEPQEETFTSKVLHLPVVIDHNVRRYVLAYLNHFAGLREAFHRSAPFIGEMAKVFEGRGLPGEFVYLAFAESGFAHDGAGPWQFTKPTARRFGLRIDDYVDERRDPIKSTRAAAEYLTALHNQVGGDWRLAVVGWNTGEASVDKFMALRGSSYERMARILPNHTRALLNRFIAVTFIAHHVSGLGFTPSGFTGGSQEIKYDRILVRGGARLDQIAEQVHTSVEDLRMLNPALLRDVVPPSEDSYNLLIPHSALTAITVPTGSEG